MAQIWNNFRESGLNWERLYKGTCKVTYRKATKKEILDNKPETANISRALLEKKLRKEEGVFFLVRVYCYVNPEKYEEAYVSKSGDSVWTIYNINNK